MVTWNEIRETLEQERDAAAGIGLGIGAQTGEWLAGNPVGTYLDPWNGDKLLHFGFSYGLTRGTIRAMEGAAEGLHLLADRTGNDAVERYLRQAGDTVADPTFRQKAVAAAGVILLFSVAKESWDAAPDYVDVVANYTGWGGGMLKEYGYDNVKRDAVKIAGRAQNAYENVRARYR